MWIALKLPPATEKSVVSIKDQKEYQFTYFNEYFIQGNFKYPRINEIHRILGCLRDLARGAQICWRLSVAMWHVWSGW